MKKGWRDRREQRPTPFARFGERRFPCGKCGTKMLIRNAGTIAGVVLCPSCTKDRSTVFTMVNPKGESVVLVLEAPNAEKSGVGNVYPIAELERIMLEREAGLTTA